MSGIKQRATRLEHCGLPLDVTHTGWQINKVMITGTNYDLTELYAEYAEVIEGDTGSGHPLQESLREAMRGHTWN